MLVRGHDDDVISTGSDSDRRLNSHDSRVCQAHNPVATAPGTDLITKPVRDSPDRVFGSYT